MLLTTCVIMAVLHSKQCFEITSLSMTSPVSTRIATTTRYFEQNLLLRQVPSTLIATGMVPSGSLSQAFGFLCSISSHILDAASFILISASFSAVRGADFRCRENEGGANSFGRFITAQRFSKICIPPLNVLQAKTDHLFTSKLHFKLSHVNRILSLHCTQSTSLLTALLNHAFFFCLPKCLSGIMGFCKICKQQIPRILGVYPCQL